MLEVEKLNLRLIGYRENGLILLFEFIEPLLRALLLFRVRRSSSEHFVKESHDRFLSSRHRRTPRAEVFIKPVGVERGGLLSQGLAK